MEIDGDGTVLAWRFGALAHVSSPCRGLSVTMRHRERNIWKEQASCERYAFTTIRWNEAFSLQKWGRGLGKGIFLFLLDFSFKIFLFMGAPGDNP